MPQGREVDSREGTTVNGLWERIDRIDPTARAGSINVRRCYRIAEPEPPMTVQTAEPDPKHMEVASAAAQYVATVDACNHLAHDNPLRADLMEERKDDFVTLRKAVEKLQRGS